MPTCKTLSELSPERVREVLDLIDRMHTGRGADERVAMELGNESLDHCPFYRGDGVVADACSDGCRIDELLHPSH